MPYIYTNDTLNKCVCFKNKSLKAKKWISSDHMADHSRTLSSTSAVMCGRRGWKLVEGSPFLQLGLGLI